MNYLATKLAIVQVARSQGKTKTEKTDKSCHPADIPTKPPHGKERMFKRERLLGLMVVPPAKSSSSATAATGAGGAEDEADRARRAPSGPPPGTWDRALGRLLGRGRG